MTGETAGWMPRTGVVEAMMRMTDMSQEVMEVLAVMEDTGHSLAVRKLTGEC